MAKCTNQFVNDKALAGIRIIDYSQFLSGSFATATLANFGAETMHLEHLHRPDGQRGVTKYFGISRQIPGGRNVNFDTINRNKKGIALDVDNPAAKEIICRLVEKSDVFLTNYTMQHLVKRGLDYDSLSPINSRLVYCSLSGFGRKGPVSDFPAFDQLGQARGGMMMSGQDPNVPRIPWPGLADMSSALTAALGVMIALFARDRLGVGQEVTTSLLGSIIALQETFIAQFGLLGIDTPKRGRTEAGNPLLNFFQCKDGKWIHLNLYQSDRHWPAFCKAVGKPDWEKDDRFQNAIRREENTRELTHLLDEMFLTKTCEEWMTILWEYNLSTSPVQSIPDLFSDPQVLENEYIIEAEHPTLGPVRLAGHPLQLSRTPARFECFGPMHGQHTEEILIDVCGYTWDDIESFKERGVI